MHAARSLSARDRLFDGIALTIFGVALLAAAVAPVIAFEGDGGWTAATVFSIPAVLALGLGIAWSRRIVTVSEQGIALEWAFAKRTFAHNDIAGVRIRPAMGGVSPKSAQHVLSSCEAFETRASPAARVRSRFRLFASGSRA